MPFRFLYFSVSTLLGIILFGPLWAQTNPPATYKKNIEKYIRQWGVAKFFSDQRLPQEDWDSVFIREINAVAFGDANLTMLKPYQCIAGMMKKPPKVPLSTSASIYDLKLDTSIWGTATARIIANGCVHCGITSKENGVLDFSKEQPFPVSGPTPFALRMLALARYWNIVTYYNPYKYLMDSCWEEALYKFIPLFATANTDSAYFFVLSQITSSINDSHASLTGWPKTLSPYGKYTLPFEAVFIEDTLVIKKVFPNLTPAGLAVGDVIQMIDGISISDLVNSHKQYVVGGNNTITRNTMLMRLLAGRDSGGTVMIQGKIIKSPRCLRSVYFENMRSRELAPSRNYFFVDSGNIGYIHMAAVDRSSLLAAFKTFEKCKAIILDIREYPPNMAFEDLGHLVETKGVPYAVDFPAELNFPGKFKENKPAMLMAKGRKKFAGKVVGLINLETVSRGEFCAMAVRSLKNSTLIGSQTAGTDGVVSGFALPGGYQTRITTMGCAYPDGTQTQRIGIIPDIYVRSNIQAVITGKDEILEAAVKFIQTH